MRSIYVVDDDPSVRSSLAQLLALEDGVSVRAFDSGDGFLAAMAELPPGVVLLDFHMPGSSGLDVLRKLRADGHFAAVILTGLGNMETAVEAMKAGAADFIEKPYRAELLLERIETAFSRLERNSAAALRRRKAQERIDRLSAREKDVLKGLIEGRSNKVIAYELALSPRTVEIYRAKLMDRLGVGSLSEALRIAFTAGLFPETE